jgi:hypothetical protein
MYVKMMSDQSGSLPVKFTLKLLSVKVIKYAASMITHFIVL